MTKEQVAIRTFNVTDHAACLRILQSNTPRYFTPEDKAEYSSFLNKLPGPYVVLEYKNNLVGCGGWALSDDKKLGHLTWGMIDAAYHNQSLGSYLLQYRLDALQSTGVPEVQLNTTQHVSAFFERAGFVISEQIPNEYGPGLDRVGMVFRFNSHG